MNTKDTMIRNIPNDTFRILKMRFEKSKAKSFNEYILSQLEIIAHKNNYENLVNEYLDRQKILIDIVNRNTQTINLITNLTLQHESEKNNED